MFDLPTFTKEHRKAASRYRKELLKDGFSMMQYSVYYRHCVSAEHAEVHSKYLSAQVPAEGEVRFITITDKQFAKMRIIQGKKLTEPENTPAQLEFF
jgi:CRISPR-associated protein Cas2